MSNSRIRFSLRSKLLLLSVIVLIIPYMGFDYLRQMETYLRDTLESSLVDTAYAVAGALNDKSEFFETSLNNETNVLYVHQLKTPVQLDGYTDEWSSYLSWAETYSEDNDSFKLIVSIAK